MAGGVIIVQQGLVRNLVAVINLNIKRIVLWAKNTNHQIIHPERRRDPSRQLSTPLFNRSVCRPVPVDRQVHDAAGLGVPAALLHQLQFGGQGGGSVVTRPFECLSPGGFRQQIVPEDLPVPFVGRLKINDRRILPAGTDRPEGIGMEPFQLAWLRYGRPSRSCRELWRKADPLNARITFFKTQRGYIHGKFMFAHRAGCFKKALYTAQYLLIGRPFAV
jgi:hypothetical protein